jgi:hypothetical protein
VISVLLKAYSNKGKTKPKLNIKDSKGKKEDETNVPITKTTTTTTTNLLPTKLSSLVSEPINERVCVSHSPDSFLFLIDLN